MQNCAVGSHSSAIVSSKGEVWVKGANYLFQMGVQVPPKYQQCYPTTKLNFPQSIVRVCIGSYTSLFLGANGDVWTCGISVAGQEIDKVPRQIANLPPIQAISCSNNLATKKQQGVYF